ncbi:MAG: YfhO family protein, partial [Rhodospirillales bacterium]
SQEKVAYFSPEVGDLVVHQFGPDADVRQLGALHKKSPDAVFFRLAGCSGRSKLQLITRYEEDVLEASASVAAAAMGSAVLVERTDGGERRLVRSVAGEYPNAMSLAAQGIAITGFSANRLAATVKIAGPDGAWLVYADGFHPGWRATLNGKPLPVWKANMAFKAVFLPPGVNAVVFDFTQWGWQWAMWLVAFSSGLVIVLGSLWPIKKPERG